MSNQAKIRTPTPIALVENVMHLVSLPKIYLSLQKVLDDPKHSRDDVAEIIGYDPSLSVRILRIANSAYYGFPSKIDSISAAVNIIGEMDLRNIVLASTVVKSMRVLSQVGINIDDFWLHSINCGLTARLIGKQVRDCDAEGLFLSGMLHDVGILILYREEPELAHVVEMQMEEHQQSRDIAEQDLLGFDHAEVGGLLIQAWGLSPKLKELIFYHHRPELAKEYHREAQILALANRLAHRDFELDSFIQQIDPESANIMRTIDLDKEALPDLIETAQAQSNEIQSIICG